MLLLFVVLVIAAAAEVSRYTVFFKPSTFLFERSRQKLVD